MTETGRLRTFVHLQAPVETQDDEGDTVRDFETRRTCWAEIRALSGRDFFSSGADRANIDSRVRVRAGDVRDLTKDWRILTESGRVLQVKVKLQDDQDRALAVLLCGEVA